MIRFSEKGGKETEIPVHHKLEELLDQYLETSGLRNQPNAPLFPIALGKTRKLGNRPATRIDAARMLKRRLKDAGLSDAFSPHSFRATGITNYLENGGTLEVAQRIAGHADNRTTKLYDRRGQKVLLEDMERNAELGISLHVEYGKMRSEPDECALGVDLRGIHSAFYFCQSEARNAKRVVGFKSCCGLACSSHFLQSLLLNR
jgi:Phage integrase family